MYYVLKLIHVIGRASERGLQREHRTRARAQGARRQIPELSLSESWQLSILLTST